MQDAGYVEAFCKRVWLLSTSVADCRFVILSAGALWAAGTNEVEESIVAITAHVCRSRYIIDSSTSFVPAAQRAPALRMTNRQSATLVTIHILFPATLKNVRI